MTVCCGCYFKGKNQGTNLHCRMINRLIRATVSGSIDHHTACAYKQWAHEMSKDLIVEARAARAAKKWQRVHAA